MQITWLMQFVILIPKMNFVFEKFSFSIFFSIFFRFFGGNFFDFFSIVYVIIKKIFVFMLYL